MGNGMNKIMPGLFIGNFQDAKSTKQLEENNITHIIAIHDHAKPVLENIKYKCIDAADSPSQNLSDYFVECIVFIHKARLNNGNVLVHCIAGVSRSCTICCAYLMVATGVNWSDAILACRKSRPQVNPNYGFQKQLKTFESDSSTIRQELIKRFGELSQVDETYIKDQVASYDEDDPEPHTSKSKSITSVDMSNALGTTPTFGNYERKRINQMDNAGKDT